MPSIEIACIGIREPLSPPAVSFAVVFERGLVSHRSPSPRFQADFDRTSGSLYHLGDPAFSATNGGFFNGYELLSEACRAAEPTSFLEFDTRHLAGVRELLGWLLDQSPPGRLLFTTDWQFGPADTIRASPMTLAEFWKLHESRDLMLNAAYPIARAV
jgi:hypothetical protein